MKLFLVEYCNGAEYDDWCQYFVGVYTTYDLAQEASKIAIVKHGAKNGRAYCDICEIIVDKMPEKGK
jgi:hypothetical protein